MYENNAVLFWQPLYVCFQGAIYLKLSSWQKSHFHSLRLGEHRKHKVLRTLRGTRCESCLMRLSLRVVFCFIDKIWWCLDKVRWTIRPKYLYESVSLRSILLNVWNGCEIWGLEMIKTLVFVGLKFTFHNFDQLDKACKSRVKTWWRWSGQREENNKAALSANNETEDSMDSAISLAYIRNNNGPRTEPCSTPQFV